MTEPTQTPRTDAASFDFQFSIATGVQKIRPGLGTLVGKEDCAAIELDLAQSTQRIAELESRVKQLEGALLLDTPWPITEILANLHDATDHLFKIHDCDHHGYEMWLQAQMQAVTCCQLLTDAISPPPPAVEVEFVAALESKLASMSDTELTDAMIRAGFELDPLAMEKAQSLSEVKAAFAAGKRVQRQSFLEGVKCWLGVTKPDWNPECNWRIHPDDDAPPVQTEEKPADPTKEMFKALDEEECHRERLGRRVREVWIAWANRQPNPKPSWLVPYDELSEADKEADRCIGCAIWGDCIEAHSEAIASHAVKHLQPATVPLAVAEGQWQDIDTAPKDGTEILVLEWGTIHHVQWGGQFHNSFVYKRGIGFVDHASHWMPLPPAPATLQASTKE